MSTTIVKLLDITGRLQHSVMSIVVVSIIISTICPLPWVGGKTTVKNTLHSISFTVLDIVVGTSRLVIVFSSALAA